MKYIKKKKVNTKDKLIFPKISFLKVEQLRISVKKWQAENNLWHHIKGDMASVL